MYVHQAYMVHLIRMHRLWPISLLWGSLSRTQRSLVRTSDSKTAACMACTVEYTPSVYAIASTRGGLYLDKGAEMACETPLEGDKVRVDTYSEVNSKSCPGQFSV